MAKYKITNGTDEVIIEVRTITQARKKAYELSRVKYIPHRHAVVFKFDTDIWEYVRIGNIKDNYWLESSGSMYSRDTKYIINPNGKIDNFNSLMSRY